MINQSEIEVIEKLQRYAKRKIKIWNSNYPNTICGFHIGRKRRKGKLSKTYSIVFHVKKKMDEGKISSNLVLPKHVTIKLDNKKMIIPTDVIETGIGELTQNYSPGCGIVKKGTRDIGTIGPLVKKGNDVYILSNMHVLGKSILVQGYNQCWIPKIDQSLDVSVVWENRLNPIACFEYGLFDGLIDAAIARIPNEYLNLLKPEIPGVGIPTGYKVLTNEDVYGKGYQVFMCGVRNRKSVRIVARDCTKNFLLPWGGEMFFRNLLQITPCVAINGDSGSVVIDNYGRIIGIIGGSDIANSYVLPIEPILKKFKITLIVQPK